MQCLNCRKLNRGKAKAWQELLSELYQILDKDEENKNYGIERMQMALDEQGYEEICFMKTDGALTVLQKPTKLQNIIKQDFSAQVPCISGVGKCWDNSRMGS